VPETVPAPAWSYLSLYVVSTWLIAVRIWAAAAPRPFAPASDIAVPVDTSAWVRCILTVL